MAGRVCWFSRTGNLGSCAFLKLSAASGPPRSALMLMLPASTNRRLTSHICILWVVTAKIRPIDDHHFDRLPMVAGMLFSVSQGAGWARCTSRFACLGPNSRKPLVGNSAERAATKDGLTVFAPDA